MEEKQALLPGNVEVAETGIMAETKLELTVDQFLEEYIGSMGWSQLLHVILVSIPWFFDCQNTLVSSFSDALPAAWRCKTNTTTTIAPTSISLCNNITSSREAGDAASVCGLVPGTWEWVGGHTSSIVAEWDIICDRTFLAALPASLFFLGSILGSALYGSLGDGFLGRKRTMLLSCILTSITCFITSLSPNLWIYALFRFANGFARSGIETSCIVLAAEAVGRKWRGQVGQFGFFFYTVGFISLPVMAYLTRHNWRDLYRIMSLLPLVYSLLMFPLISESPRWLLVRGRSEEALEVLRKFARVNGKDLPQNLSLTIPLISKAGVDQTAKRMVMVMTAGFGVGFVYYGVQLNVENLDFNLYVAVAINALIQIPSIVIDSVLLSFTSRRLLFSVSAFLAGVSCILCTRFSGGNDTNPNGSWAQLTTEAIGFMATSTAFDVLYIYCIELFPTNIRNFAASMMRQALMLGASVAPWLVVVGRFSPSLSFIIFGILSILSGLVTLWLPETRDAPLYETLQQQEEGEKRDAESRPELGN
ncbi:hypothetical protein Tsubulata_923720 [Turnera subulata]|uniref:Major facilitator superfamily (MFS) profile domain-containing protein n=1 Tax=Turnera subulata TaxID=218843 RepID=A0A9Q0JAX8_9ROSI|nr:hypothetical protein Tsubulata_923720 [Turnera subulata]